MSVPTPPPHTGEPAELNEAASRIVTVAERLFAERGFDGVSIRDIAEAAGISKANVFHHFANKSELYRAVIERCSDEFRRLLQNHIRQAGSWQELADQFAFEHLRRTMEQSSATRLFLRQLIGVDAAEGKELLENSVVRNFTFATEAIAEFQRRGEIDQRLNPAVLTLTLLGSHLSLFLMHELLQRTDSGRELTDLETYHRAVMDLLTDGLHPKQEQQSE